MENRNGPVNARLNKAIGTAEPEAAIEMLSEVTGTHQIIAGADKVYGTAAFVGTLREMKVTPHVAQNISGHRCSNVDGRTTRLPGYRISQVIRKRIEEANGDAQTRQRGLPRVRWMFQLEVAAYNPVRLPRLLVAG